MKLTPLFLCITFFCRSQTISIVSFSHTCTNSIITLNWQTVQELQTVKFEIQAADTSGPWESVGSLPAAGNSSTLIYYQFTDPAQNKLKLYRIVLYNLAGFTRISQTIKTNCPDTRVRVNILDPAGRLLRTNIFYNEIAKTGLTAGLYIIQKIPAEPGLPGNNFLCYLFP